MPYIKQNDRLRYLTEVDSLSVKLQEKSTPGELNFVISKIVWELFSKNPSYTKGNELMGVLECVKQEFYRRLLAEYEIEKIVENGDII